MLISSSHSSSSPSISATRLIAKLPTIVARYERRREGLEPVPPDPSLSYAENFLTMLHGEQPSERDARAFDVAMILHAEHELNASTFTARVIAGTGADLTGAVVGAIAALSGPLHGGANEAAMRMFERWGTPEQTPAEVRAMLERKEKLSGFGHPLYRAYDPRALILKPISEEFSHDAGEPNWYEITLAAEQTVLQEKGLYPNVDLWSASVYRYLGVPTDLFTPLFAASRVAGCLSGEAQCGPRRSANRAAVVSSISPWEAETERRASASSSESTPGFTCGNRPVSSSTSRAQRARYSSVVEHPSAASSSRASR